MTNTEFIVRDRSGINHLPLTPSLQAQAVHFGVVDGLLLLGFMATFVGLVFLLAR